MTYVITQPCIGVKDASCVDVCPVDCIHPSQNEEEFDTVEQLYINPDECIDCGACEPACPVTAIFEESATPDEWKQFIKINADFFKQYREKLSCDKLYAGLAPLDARPAYNLSFTILDFFPLL